MYEYRGTGNVKRTVINKDQQGNVLHLTLSETRSYLQTLIAEHNNMK